MDPPSLINEESYPNANAASYNLAEIWQFQMNGYAVISESGGGVGERRAQFSPNLNRLEDVPALNQEISANSAAVNDNKKRLQTTASSLGGAELQNSKQDYIHVRARRGQATDSHSLAERGRREKISGRMKTLQDLVPGCNKVFGKALVLDEIINYIQSLQHQVEFLSMKIEAVNARTSPRIEGLGPIEYGEQVFDRREFGLGGSSPEWLHMQVGGAFERRT